MMKKAILLCSLSLVYYAIPLPLGAADPPINSLPSKEKSVQNIYANIPNTLPKELFEDLIKTENVRIERILSHGHSSPETGWYDQTEHEWVMVLKGQGVLEFEDGSIHTLSEGDHINIGAGVKHRVISTDPNSITVWLAVFYK